MVAEGKDHYIVMAASLKNAPIFLPEENDDYVNWRKDIMVWKMFTETKVEKLGAAVYLAIQGKARECVRDMDMNILGTAQGFDEILKVLDDVYMKDENSRAFCAMQEFYEYSRNSGEGFPDFIVAFEQKYNKLKQFKMDLPEGVKAFFLLKAANLSSETEKLARAVSKLEYKDMRDHLMKIFGDPGVLSGKDDVPPVKEEVFYGEHDDRRNYNRNRGRGRSRFPRATRGGPRRDLRCFECNSPKHFVNECPHRGSAPRSEDVQMNVHITLVTANPLGTLLSETLGKMILDSGCSKTVAGARWMEEFMHTLQENDRKDVLERYSSALFRFGDNIENKSLKLVTVPIYIGKLRILLDVEVVDKHIPLLLSRKAMKALDMQIDFKRDVVSVKGKEMNLHCTSTGHYVIPVTIIPSESNHVNFVFKLDVLENCSKEEKKRKALKLHRQFSHASKEKLIKLLRNSGCNDKDFFDVINECCNKCTVCQLHKKPSLKPVVCMPLAAKFNEVICMDLKEFTKNKIWILHLIDAGTRYSAACLINTKRKDVIVACIFRMWIAYFGSPVKFLSDNGGEFGNDVLQEMSEKLGVITETTAAESPFSNGIVERHNSILYEAMCKTMKETKCEPDLALAWSVSAKNSLASSNGYSPNQLVFGQNANMPSLLTDMPPALEPTTSSEIVRKNLEALHSARKNYIQAESSERIRRALHHKVRSFADEEYKLGEKVYFKKKGHKGWKGPANVIGVDHKNIIVRQGTLVYRVHPCNMMKMSQVDTGGDKELKKNIRNPNRGVFNGSAPVTRHVEDDESDDDNNSSKKCINDENEDLNLVVDDEDERDSGGELDSITEEGYDVELEEDEEIELEENSDTVTLDESNLMANIDLDCFVDMSKSTVDITSDKEGDTTKV